VTGHLGVERPDRNPWTPWDIDGPAPGGQGPARVYCLPHAGGSAGSYLPWTRSDKAPGVRFVPVELPGRGTRAGEPLPTSMDELADGVLSVLRTRPEQEKFLLFGHSMGAQVAYETTRRLAVAGRPLPHAVVVSGCRPPGAPPAVTLHEESDDRLLQGITELGGMPAELLEHRDMLGILLPVMRADLALLARYSQQARPAALPCPVVAFTGSEDQHVGLEWITGWRSTTADRFRHRVFPGDHFYLHGQADEVIADIASAAGGPRHLADG
jgi:medium-chain acyl-[acyl-carrier-protein] hydrolase